MKKIIILSVAFALNLSACELFGPVPDSIDAYSYRIQAKVENGQGVVLCDLMYPEYQGWPTAAEAIFYGLTGEVLKVPFGESASAKVFIETTLPNWTMWEFTALGDFIVEGTLNGAALTGNYLTDFTVPLTDGLTYTMNEKANELFKVMWKDPCLTLIDWRNANPPSPDVYYVFLFPAFSEYITFERIDPYFVGDATFTVRGEDQWNHGHVWTAFTVQFGTAASAAQLVVNEVEIPTPVGNGAALPDASSTAAWTSLGANGVTFTYAWTLTTGKDHTGVTLGAAPTYNLSWGGGTANVYITLKVTATLPNGETNSFTKDFTI